MAIIERWLLQRGGSYSEVAINGGSTVDRYELLNGVAGFYDNY